MTLLTVAVLELWSTAARAERVRSRASRDASPEWTLRPPREDVESLYFVGFASGQPSLAEARDVAVKKAAAEVAGFLGQTVKSVFAASEVESSLSRTQSVSLKLEVIGRDEELRGVRIVDTYWEEWRNGESVTYESFALVAYARSELESVLKAREDLNRGLAMTALEGLERSQVLISEWKLAEAGETLERAAALAGKIQIPVALDHPTVRTSAALTTLIASELGRLAALVRKAERRIVVDMVCSTDVQPACTRVESEVMAGLARMGFEPESRISAKTSTTGVLPGLAVEIELEAEPPVESGGITFVGAKGSFRVVRLPEGVVLHGAEIPRQKGGQLTAGRATEMAFSALGKKLILQLRDSLARSALK
ncbi:MAG: hypothetical protein HY791_18030 [Deltaproteobacteria bacterium]|nr:hypothetical protein [Deltaproteobacteria bacterium]